MFDMGIEICKNMKKQVVSHVYRTQINASLTVKNIIKMDKH